MVSNLANKKPIFLKSSSKLELEISTGKSNFVKNKNPNDSIEMDAKNK